MNSTILFRIIINKNTKNCKKNRGWAKSPAPLLRVRVNISAQWLIGRFVRVLHSKSNHYDCCEQSSLHFRPQTVSQTVWAVRGWEFKRSGRPFKVGDISWRQSAHINWSLGIDCFSSTTWNKELLTNSFYLSRVLSHSQRDDFSKSRLLFYNWAKLSQKWKIVILF